MFPTKAISSSLCLQQQICFQFQMSLFKSDLSGAVLWYTSHYFSDLPMIHLSSPGLAPGLPTTPHPNRAVLWPQPTQWHFSNLDDCYVTQGSAFLMWSLRAIWLMCMSAWVNKAYRNFTEQVTFIMLLHLHSPRGFASLSTKVGIALV